MSKDKPPVFEYGKGKKVTATRDNASLYTFYGRWSMYSHIFVYTDPKRSVGVYVFRHEKGFQEAAEYLMKHNYPAYLNLRTVADCDKEAFEKTLEKNTADIDGGVPTSWK